MNEKKKSYFKEFLSEKLNTLVKQAETTVTDMTDTNTAFPDPADRAALETDRNFELKLRDREHKLIKKIKKALERIENGTFGICEDCSEEISGKRLMARPVTTQCIDCKTKEELLEKSLGL